jgi:anti-anti-sigma factor
MTELASLQITRDQDVVFAVIKGEVDPSNARELGRDVTASVPNDAMAVVLDLTAVDYLDSSGVQMIFELAERLDARQQRLAVVVPEGAPARTVLDIVSLDATATLADDRDDAMSRLGARGG